ncbi:hypothetical protein Ctob_007438 [Chrysochromulina tobinii]|uniref:Uncharacterized protein n=1 Tax=Chrysochromulina tobinii TaxID=1460289 RepID=A0A0M0K103_9EUKA|nr:hypothetical protein Ctob_007438 [Chrysochromulina tobinii]|eukprot:KOO32475.1 hypothetical protein Ctob_007438 [Chrysochromulina sp. CCMP291]
MRWNTKGVKFREHTFLQNPNVPAVMKQNTVTVSVGSRGEDVPATASNQTHMLCDYNTLPDGRITKPITWCNIEGYGCL